MLVSIMMSNYNKNTALKNTLHSIASQKISFPIEIVIGDDGSDVDPYPIIEEELLGIQFKYQKFPRLGFIDIHQKLIQMVTGDIVCLSSCDTMFLDDNSLQKIIDSVKPGYFVLPTVINLEYSSTKNIMDRFEKIRDKKSVCKGQMLYYQGSRRSRYFFFFGSLLKSDLDSIQYSPCDVIFDQRLRENNLKPIYSDEILLHQAHKHYIYECPLIKECKLCRRSRKKKINI